MRQFKDAPPEELERMLDAFNRKKLTPEIGPFGFASYDPEEDRLENHTKKDSTLEYIRMFCWMWANKNLEIKPDASKDGVVLSSSEMKGIALLLDELVERREG